MKLSEIPTYITLAILAVIAYLVYKAYSAYSNCGMQGGIFQYITTGSCSTNGATGQPGNGFPGAPGSTAPGQCIGTSCDNPSQNACGFWAYITGKCINLTGGSCGVSDYALGNCSAGAPPQVGLTNNPDSSSTDSTFDTTADGYSSADDIFSGDALNA